MQTPGQAIAHAKGCPGLPHYGIPEPGSGWHMSSQGIWVPPSGGPHQDWMHTYWTGTLDVKAPDPPEDLEKITFGTPIADAALEMADSPLSKIAAILGIDLGIDEDDDPDVDRLCATHETREQLREYLHQGGRLMHDPWGVAIDVLEDLADA